MSDRSVLMERGVAAAVLLCAGLWALSIWGNHRAEIEKIRQVAMREVQVAINQNIVKSTAHRLHLEPALLMGVASVESGFLADAESSKGAKGVMQVRDATGAEIARYLGLEHWDLFNAEDCALIGAVYLKDLLRMYHRDMHLALAAYHAGPLVVDQWIHQSDGLPGEQVVETFAYRQTRSYVRSVLNAADKYRGHM